MRKFEQFAAKHAVAFSLAGCFQSQFCLFGFPVLVGSSPWIDDAWKVRNISDPRSVTCRLVVVLSHTLI